MARGVPAGTDVSSHPVLQPKVNERHITLIYDALAHELDITLFCSDRRQNFSGDELGLDSSLVPLYR